MQLLISRMKQLFTSVLLAAILSGCAESPVRIPEEHLISKSLGDNEISRFLCHRSNQTDPPRVTSN